MMLLFHSLFGFMLICIFYVTNVGVTTFADSGAITIAPDIELVSDNTSDVFVVIL